MAFKNRSQVALAVESEGLGYFITSYTSADSMPDDELKQAFKAASKALRKFQSLLPDAEDVTEEEANA